MSCVFEHSPDGAKGDNSYDNIFYDFRMKTTDTFGVAERHRHTATAGATDFLSETHLESNEHGRVALRALAGRLAVSPPAVSRMAQRLVRRGLLKREGACGLELTEAGLGRDLLEPNLAEVAIEPSDLTFVGGWTRKSLG